MLFGTFLNYKFVTKSLRKIELQKRTEIEPKFSNYERSVQIKPAPNLSRFYKVLIFILLLFNMSIQNDIMEFRLIHLGTKNSNEASLHDK